MNTRSTNGRGDLMRVNMKLIIYWTKMFLYSFFSPEVSCEKRMFGRLDTHLHFFNLLKSRKAKYSRHLPDLK